MAPPVMGDATSTSEIQADFDPLTTAGQLGGAVIDSYYLEWDQGTGTWMDLIG